MIGSRIGIVLLVVAFVLINHAQAQILPTGVDSVQGVFKNIVFMMIISKDVFTRSSSQIFKLVLLKPNRASTTKVL